MAFFQMRVEKLDAYALKHYAFTIHKTNTYFTCATILLSLAIIAVSIVISLPTISHIWLSRAELPSSHSESLAFPDALTSTLICYRSNDPSTNGTITVPSARLMDQNEESLSFPFVSEDELYSIRPNLTIKLGTKFGCYDISGFDLSSAGRNLIIEVQAKNATIFIETTTESQISLEQESSFINMTTTNAYGRQRLLRILHAILDDSLMGDCPTILTKFYYDEFNNVLSSPYFFPHPSPNAKFLLRLYIPTGLETSTQTTFNNNKKTLTISRNSIGYIIGSVLSWISILSLGCSILVSPLLEMQFRLKTIQSLFNIRVADRNASIIRFMIATCIPGIFPKEDIYVRMWERFEELKDIATILKYQKMASKVSIPTPSSIETEIFAVEESFDGTQSDEIGIHLFAQENDEFGKIEFDASEDIVKVDRGKVMRRALLTWLDPGSDSINVHYKGHGHGSKISVCLTALFIAGFIAFLFFFGVLQFTTTTNIYQNLSVTEFTYEFRYNELIFVTEENSQVLTSLLDGDLQPVEKIVLSTKNCLFNITDPQRSQILAYGQYHYCLQRNLTLIQSSDPSQFRTLYVDNTNFQMWNLAIFHISPPSPSPVYQPIDSKVFISPLPPGPTVHYRLQLPITLISNDGVPNDPLTQFTLLKEIDSYICPLSGINMVLAPAQTSIETSTSSLMDMVQNVWSMAIICFTVLLAKLAKYINRSVMERRVGRSLSQFRNDLCILISKVSAVAGGKQGRELNRMKYYLKSDLRKEARRIGGFGRVH